MGAPDERGAQLRVSSYHQGVAQGGRKPNFQHIGTFLRPAKTALRIFLKFTQDMYNG